MSNDCGAWDRTLLSVNKPARYTDHEWNVVRKRHDEVSLRFVLAYPDVYEVGMAHLGLRILYHLVNRDPRCVAERVFSPWGDMEDRLRTEGQPLVSLESSTPLREFDVIGITLPYELTFTNVLNLLDLGGVPLHADARAESDPLVIGGGAATVNPEPLTDFFDAFVLGEAEDVMPRLIDVLETTKGRPRAERLRQLAGIEGVYVPSLYQVTYHDDGAVSVVTARDGAPPIVRRQAVADFDAAFYPTEPIVPFLETIHDRVTLEIMRGCTQGCRFCQAGMTARPRRERRVETLLAAADTALRSTGYDEISLLAFNAPDYSRIAELVDALTAAHGERGVGVSLPSLRIDTFSLDLAQRISQVRKAGLTFAPEAATDRLRRVINKNVTEADLIRVAEAAFQSGWHSLKLYFMIGLPTETDEEVAAIVDLTQDVVALGRRTLGDLKGKLRVSLSLGSLVPKAATPFQWEPQDAPENLARKQDVLRARLRSKQVRFSWQQVEVSRLEAALARGDRRLGAVIEAAWRLGCRFDAWSEQFRYGLWGQAFAKCGLDPAFYANRQRPATEVFPWDHLDAGVSKAFLWRERELAYAETSTPDCAGAACQDCGACPSGAPHGEVGSSHAADRL